MNTCQLTSRIQVNLAAIKKMCCSWLCATSMHLRKCVCVEVCLFCVFFFSFFHAFCSDELTWCREQRLMQVLVLPKVTLLFGQRRWLSSASQTSRRVWLWHSQIITLWLLEYFFFHYWCFYMKGIKIKSILKFALSAAVPIFGYSTTERQMLCNCIAAFGFIGFNSSWAALLTQPCNSSFDFPLDPSRLLLHPFQPGELWQWCISLLVPHHIVSQ